MSRNILFVPMYYRHELLDISKLQFRISKSYVFRSEAKVEIANALIIIIIIMCIVPRPVIDCTALREFWVSVVVTVNYVPTLSGTLRRHV